MQPAWQGNQSTGQRHCNESIDLLHPWVPLIKWPKPARNTPRLRGSLPRMAQQAFELQLACCLPQCSGRCNALMQSSGSRTILIQHLPLVQMRPPYGRSQHAAGQGHGHLHHSIPQPCK